jgi:arylsulfatase A-like enzyme
MWSAAVALLLSGLTGACAAAASSPKPNIVLILADDLGWTDLACYGSKLYQTPNIDRLARNGIKFAQAYSACCVCSPTRAALLTGKYPARLHITDWIPGLPPENPKLLVPDWTKYLPLEEKTIADAFKSAGYATASIGKWHLGGEEYFPEKHGFDLNIAGTAAPGVSSYFSPYKIVTLTDGPDGEYVTDRLAHEAVRWLEANQHKPFFLYLPHFAVHTPIQGKKPIAAKYRQRILPGMAQTNAMYAAMIESLDDAVGRVRAKLDSLNLADKTIVVFASDNGGRVPTTSNLPLRVGKGSCYEGGTRVPLIIYWPAVTKAGEVCETPVISMDLFPTLLEAAGLPRSQSASAPDPTAPTLQHVNAPPAFDGVSLVPLLRQNGGIARDELFWHYPHYQHYQLGGTTPYGAIRKGDFKLIEFFDNMRVELYNLRQDIGEQRNLAAQMPEKAVELRERLHAWQKEVNAQIPARNPAYDPRKPEHDPANDKKKKAEARNG